MRRNPRNRPVEVEDIVSEALTLAGGGRALLLQIAHPSVGQGVVEHSDFAERLMDRFDGTMVYLTATMFGSEAELAAMRRIVNRAHAPVRGTIAADGSAYNAFDPELQLWVAATLYQTVMDLHRRVFGPLTPAQADSAYEDLSGALSNLQLTRDRWPARRADFDAYWERMLLLLGVNDDVRAVSRQILHPRRVPWWLRPTLPLVRLVTAGLLPESVRQQFGLPWDERRQLRFERAMRWTASVYPRLPLRLRHVPRERYRAKLRRAVLAPGAAGPEDRGATKPTAQR
ncbi:oxygenase MpaB family protein [Leifsonia sp. NPDC014704]|uniref:oxygenase MpaB family protein n=1 Tax=Leifsonia sp. NPDC014704 TaxID=3364123 RepID=UPI0036F457D5